MSILIRSVTLFSLLCVVDLTPHTPALTDFGVPPTDPLDNSAHKSRPHRPGTVRPPSRSNIQQVRPHPHRLLGSLLEFGLIAAAG